MSPHVGLGLEPVFTRVCAVLFHIVLLNHNIGFGIYINVVLDVHAIQMVSMRDNANLCHVACCTITEGIRAPMSPLCQ